MSIALEVDGDSLDIDIASHHTLLTQIFLNLFNNSIFAIKNSHQRCWIRISLIQQHENEVVVHYSDSGEGISDVVVDKIFNPYFSTKTMNEGTGLGLSFCWDVMDFYTGQLEYIRSQQNTTFALSFKKEIFSCNS